MRNKIVKKAIIFAEEQSWIKQKNPTSNLYRFKRDDCVLDIWDSKKGVTVGVYEGIDAFYLKNISDEDLMEVIIDSNYLRKSNKGKLTTNYYYLKHKR